MKRKRSADGESSDIRDWVKGEFKFKPPPIEITPETKQLLITDMFPGLNFTFRPTKKNKLKRMRQSSLDEFSANKIPVKVSGTQLFFLPQKSGKAWFKWTDSKVTSVVSTGFLDDATRCGWSVVQYADGFLLQKNDLQFIVCLKEDKSSAVIRQLQ